MTEINWSILGNALNSNPGRDFTNAFQQGATQSGMALASQGDPRGMNALMQINPQAGMAMQDRQQQQRTAQANEQRLRGEETRQQQENNRAIAERFTGFAQHVRRLPVEQRRAVIQQNAQMLTGMGVDPQMLASFDPSDGNLDALISQGMTASQAEQMETGGRREVDGIVLDRNMQPIYETPYPRIIPGPDGQFNIQPRIGLEGLRGGAPAPQSSQGAPQQQGQPPVVEALPPGFVYEDEGGAAPGQGSFQPNEFQIDPNYWQPTDGRR